MKDKKKGSQQSATIAESLETPDFRPYRAYYLSIRDINTTVSTWPEFGQLLSDVRFKILRKWKPVNQYFSVLEVCGNISTVFMFVGTYQSKYGFIT